MMDLHVLDEFTRTLSRTYPNDVPVTIQAVAGAQQLQFAAPIEAQANSWRAGLMEFLDGDCAGLQFVVSESQTQTAVIASPFYSRKPAAGDTVRFHGGPLAEAQVFQEDPETILQAVEAGVRYFLVCTVVNGSIAWKGLGGRSHVGVEATQRIFGVEVTCETKLITGTPTVEDMYANYTALPLLKEQVAFLAQAFRVDAQNRIQGIGEIEWSRGFLQRPGHATMRAYVLNFDVAVS